MGCTMCRVLDAGVLDEPERQWQLGWSAWRERASSNVSSIVITCSGTDTEGLHKSP